MPFTVLDRSDGILDRMKRASDKVEERLDRAASALTEAGVPYAVTGGMAVSAWVATVDESAVRLTRDVDVLLRREDLQSAREVLETVGFVYRHSGGMDMFLDHSGAKAGDAVHVLMAGERVKETDFLPQPEVGDTPVLGGVRYIPLDSLVRMKLSVWRRKDQVHILDLIGVGLVDESWLSKLPAVLEARLKELLDNPDG